jgi:hypothetical protein
MSVKPVSQLTPRPVSWLWPGRLALGKLAMLDGDPDLGKSLVTLDLCTRLSRGLPFPDGSTSPGPANALVFNGEDDGEDTIGPRLQTLGADLDRVFVEQLDADDGSGPLRLPTDWKRLEDALKQTEARLLVIDPIMAFLDPKILACNEQSVRRALDPLARIAHLHTCAVLLVRHLNKRSDSRSRYRGTGSMAFLCACRSGWLIARDPREPGQCVLAQVKNTLAPAQPSLAYRVQLREDGHPLLTWLGPHPSIADDLLAGPNARSPVRPVHLAREFLRTFLADGPRTAREIWPAAQDRGFSRPTLKRAKRREKIKTIWSSIDGRPVGYWALPGQKLPPDDALAALEPWLAPLREKFPPATPLDDL